MRFHDLQQSWHLRAAALVQDLTAAGQHQKAEAVQRQGVQLFLSDPTAAQPAGVYFCGLKPYGAPGRQYPAAPLPQDGYVEYRDGRSRSPFYARARQLIRTGLDRTLGPEMPLEAALCTNWYFFRAADTAQLKRYGLDRIDAAATHRKLLDVLRPRLILCAGNGAVSAYAGMLRLFGAETTTEERYLGNSRLRRAVTPYGHLIGVPHLSRYEVTSQLLDFIPQR